MGREQGRSAGALGKRCGIGSKLAAAISLEVIQQLKAKIAEIEQLDASYDMRRLRREIAVERALLDMIGAVAGEASERQCAAALGYQIDASAELRYMAWGDALRQRVAYRLTYPPAPAAAATQPREAAHA